MAFDTYSGYIMSNQFEPSTAKSFAVITDQEQFDKFLAVAMHLDAKSILDASIPRDVFKSRMVLAVIKDPDMAWRYYVEKVTVDKGVVRLQYSSKAKKSASVSLTFACPMIVSIPQVKYKAIEFIENNNCSRIFLDKWEKNFQIFFSGILIFIS